MKIIIITIPQTHQELSHLDDFIFLVLFFVFIPLFFIISSHSHCLCYQFTVCFSLLRVSKKGLVKIFFSET